MFPHEEFLKKALEECAITKLVSDLGSLYSSLVAQQTNCDDQDFAKSIEVYKILKDASAKIADLGLRGRMGLPRINHPMDRL